MDAGAILGSGWASGLNLYGVVALLGIGGRLGWIDSPSGVQRTWVIVVAVMLYSVEFVADKIPLVDSVWDSVHTVVRPLGAAALTLVLAGQEPTPKTVLLAVLSGSLALTSHGAKATTRLAANTSPEPVSNVLLSLIEDAIVAAMIWLVAKAPVVAGVTAFILAIICVLIVVEVRKEDLSAATKRRHRRLSRSSRFLQDRKVRCFR
jgi:hypothetical protein